MALRFALALCVLLAPLVTAHDASANGRPPGSSTIHFRRGQEQEILVGLTFGLVVSRDGGGTWYWMCEDAIGYGGEYDPDYEISTTGSIFATTFTGMKVARDGCTFGMPLDEKFVSTIEQGPDGKLYYGAADTGTNPDSNIYRSDDGGTTWTPSPNPPGIANDWWTSLEVTPSNPSRLYLAGYRIMGTTQKAHLLFRSDDGGQIWQALPTTQIATRPNSTIEIAGVSSTDPNLVYARVKLADNEISDAIYRSTDAGASWTKILEKGSSIAFVVRRSGELVAATKALGAVRSTDGGDTWIELASPPHINCLKENSAGEVWACTQNYGGMQAPSDGYGVMKSIDLVTWTPMLKFQEIKAPVACADGTKQRDRCDVGLWCGLCMQLGCKPTDRPDCVLDRDPGTSDGGGGCCKTSASPAPGALLLVLAVGVLLLRRRARGPGPARR